MKVRKVVFCLLLSVMLTVTFVPTFAFAAPADESDVVAGQDAETQGIDVQNEDVQDEAEEVDNAKDGTAEQPAKATEPPVVKNGETEGVVHALGDDDGDDPEEVTVTLDVPETNYLINQNIEYYAAATGNVDYMRMYVKGLYGDEGWEFYGKIGTRISSDDGTTAFATPGTYSIYVVAYTLVNGEESIGNEEEYTEVARSETVEINVTAYEGEIGNFSILTIDGNSDLTAEVTRGDLVTLEYGEAENAERYQVYIFDEENTNSWQYEDADEDADGISFYTDEISAGTYKVQVIADAKGYYNQFSQNQATLTVKNLDIPDGEKMYLAVSKGDDPSKPLITREEFEITAYCPGADWIEIVTDSENYNGYHGGNDFCQAWDSYGKSGTYILKAEAYKNNEVSGEMETLASTTIEMNVEAPNGALEIKKPELPKYIVEGDNISLQAEKPEQADGMSVSAYYNDIINDEGDSLFEGELDEDDSTVTIPTADISAGSRVDIKITAWGYGYEEAEYAVSIPVIANISDAVTMTTNLGEDNILLTGDEAVFTIEPTAEDAAIANAVFFDGSYYWELIPDEDGKYRATPDFYEAGEYIVSAVVQLEGSDEWISTEPIQFTVKSKGPLDNFRITKVNGKTEFDSVSVLRGDTVTIECEKIANADYYDTFVEKNEGSEENPKWVEYYPDDSYEDAVINLNTVSLEAGQYRVGAIAGGNGYEATQSDNMFILNVANRDMEDGEMYFTVSKGEDSKNPLLTQEELYYNAYCPDADLIEIYGYYEKDGENEISDYSESDSISGCYWYDESGEYLFKAIAYTYDETNDEFVEIASDTKTIYVDAPYGSYEVPLPEGLPPYFIFGESGKLSFSLEKPENVENLNVYVEYVVNDEYICVWDYNEDFGELDDVINADIDVLELLHLQAGYEDLEALEEGAEIHVCVHAWGLGYESGGESVYIPVISKPDESVNIAANKKKVKINEDVEVTVATSNESSTIAQVSLFDGYSFWEDEDPDEDGKYTRTLRFEDPGEYIVYAEVQLEGSDEWLTCEPVSITVTANGKTGSFDVVKVNGENNHNINVTNSDTITIECEPAANASRYWIDVYDEDDGEPIGYIEETTESTITFKPSALDGGELNFEQPYKFVVSANGEGYETTEATSEVEVTIHDKDKKNLFEEDPATCEDDGTIAYWRCSDCDGYFNEAGVEINEDDIVIPAKGHDYKFVYEWAEDGSTCKASATCKNDDSHVIEPEEVETTSAVKTPATCVAKGTTTYTATFTNEQFATQTKDIQDIATSGHKWRHVTNAAGQFRDGSAYDECTVCKARKAATILPGYAPSYVKSMKVSKAKKAFTVKWKKQNKKTQKLFNGYQIRYSTNANMSGAKYASAGKSSKSKKIKKLAAKTTYYVQVRTYTKKNGKTYYSNWTTKTVKTK